MTSNFQLEGYIRKHPMKNQTFLGVYASNMLPNENTRNGCLIANYSPAGDAGTHWVAMRRLNSDISEYFDSYGLPPDGADNILKLKTDFTGYLKQHSKTNSYEFNKKDMQRQVWNGTAAKTSGGLTKSDLMQNKHGKVVSKKQHAVGLRMAHNLTPVAPKSHAAAAAHNLRPRPNIVKKQVGTGRRLKGRGVYVSRGGNIFGDIMDGIGKVVDVGAKVVPHFL